MIVTPAVRCLVRACAGVAMGAFAGEPAHRVIAREWSDDGDAQWLARAATTPTMIGNTPALIQTLLPDFIEALVAESAAARIFANSLRLSFDGAGQIAVPTFTGDASYAAFVGEGDPIPVVQGFGDLALLTPRKLASIMVFTEEMVRSSNIEALMNDALTRSSALALDRILLDDKPEDAVRPQGVRYGLTPLTASAAPNALDALIADVETLYEGIDSVTSRTPTFVVNPGRVLAANLRSTETLPGIIGSYALQGTNDIIAIAPNVIAVSLGQLPQISAKRGMVTVHAEDSMALPIVVGGVAASPHRSMWQVDCVAVKMRWPVTWALRSPNGVAWLTAINW